MAIQSSDSRAGVRYKQNQARPRKRAACLGSDGASVQADRFAALESLAARYGGTVLLKGLGTLVRGDGGTALISTALETRSWPCRAM